MTTTGASGSHRAWVYADPLTGRPRRVRETVGTCAEAEKALTRLQRQVDEDQHPKSEITVRPGRRAVARGRRARGHHPERYDDLILLYVLPSFGDLPAGRLDAELLERFYARLHRCRVLACNGKPRGGHMWLAADHEHHAQGALRSLAL